jgi:thymidylate synthase
MALLIKADNITSAWKTLIGSLFSQGHEASPRGIRTREIINVTLEISKGLNNIIISDHRDLNYRFMVAEWMWITAGFDDVKSLAKYNSIMAKFSDNGEILNGAYGPRLDHQWSYINKTLQSSPDTRQAVSVIWTPSPTPSKDIPCTVSLQWLIRQDKLHVTVNMRSSDVWLGLPYDYFTFSQLTNGLAANLGIEVGSVTMNLGSSHLYESNFHGAQQVLVDNSEGYLSSPLILLSDGIPLKSEFGQILDQTFDTQGLSSLWRLYAEGLKYSKNDCLSKLLKLDHMCHS